MSFFNEEPKEDIVIKYYPTYTLLGRILTKDVKKFKETRDMSLILYRFCQNGTPYIPLTIEKEKKMKSKPGSAYNPR